MLATISATVGEEGNKSFEEQLDDLKEKIEAIKVKVGEQQVKLDALKDERQRKMKGVPEEIEKKKALKNEIDGLVAERNAVNKEKKEAMDS